MNPEGIKPYTSDGSKGEQVETMFDNIAPAYDFMNTAMTFGMHRRWLRKALDASGSGEGRERSAIIDLATGTGEVAFRLAAMYPRARILGVDLSDGMLRIAERKLRESHSDLDGRVSFTHGDCLSLEVPDDSFDLLTIAYGVRNFENLEKGFREFHRVLKPGGSFMILELSRPENRLTRLGYDLYARGVIPMVGRMVSRDSRAYSYLPQSIAAMPPRRRIAAMLEEAGFGNVRYRSLTLGVVTYYTGEK